MHVITRKRLREFAARHKDAEEPLAAWYAIVSRTDFASFAELKRTFRTVDKVGKFTVFPLVSDCDVQVVTSKSSGGVLALPGLTMST